MSYRTFIEASENECWSLLYATQVYNTFCCIYCNIVGEKISADEFRCDNILIKIENLKGPIQIYLVSSIASEMQNNSFDINIEIKGLTGQNQIPTTLPRPFILKTGTEVNLKRSLLPLQQASHQKPWIKDHVFDSEFYYRDSGNANPIPFSRNDISTFLDYRKGVTNPTQIAIRGQLLQSVSICTETQRYCVVT